MSRKMTTGVFASLLLAAVFLPVAAYAGFEFVAPPAAMAQQPLAGGQNNPAGFSPDDAMPAAPTPEVQMEILTPGPNEAIDTRGLLAATSQARPVSLAPEMQPMPRPAAMTGATEKLVINPYPLQGNNAGNLSSAALDAAMVGGTAYGQAAPSRAASAQAGISMMPMPGGEGIPLRASDRILPPVGDVQQAVPLVPRAPNAPPVSAQGGTYQQAVGFGRELPLALALSQVVPPEYTLQFGQTVDQGASVSWEGGKPWNVVLDEMLAPSGMRAIIANNQVTIVKSA